LQFKEDQKMKANIPNSSRLDILGSGRKSDQEIFSSVLKWRRKLGYYSIAAVVPALLASNLPASRSVEAKKPQARVIGQGTRNLANLNLSFSNRALLKQQSEFRLPHQKDSVVPLAGNDDCPGRAIPGGTYTAATPYLDSGNTIGANNTVGSILSGGYYYYYSWAAAGPDQIYSFTLTALGANPRIEVTATSSNYDPLIYVLDTLDPIYWFTPHPSCPRGTNNTVSNNLRFLSDSPGPTEIISLNFAPLGRPLGLFVDSARNDASGAGPYTIRIQDVTIAPPCPGNSIDCPEFFVAQQYRDFLNRDPDAAGFAFWTSEITSCGGDAQCIEGKRINDSGAFFLSNEFQETGYLVYRIHKASYGYLPGTPMAISRDKFLADMGLIGRDVVFNQHGWEQALENNQQAFFSAFVQRAEFTSAFPASMTPTEFVDRLFANAGVIPAPDDRTAAINEFGSATTSSDTGARARGLRRVAENSTLAQQEFNRAFVLMQYFGYLRRNPNDNPDGNFAGYNFWLDKLNQFNGDFIKAEMVKAFISSTEYRKRFGP
jgi:hypothetical protein